jgi:CRP/FNR family transcriptional regulator, cyclic AMP receptor protein
MTAIRDELLKIAGVRRLPTCRRATVVFSEGDASEDLYFLESGLVKISVKGAEGKEVLLLLVKPGECFGDHALLSDHPRTVFAEAIHDSTIYAVPREGVLALLDARPELWKWFAAGFGSRQTELEAKLRLVCLHEVEERILHYLGDLSNLLGPDSIRLSQGELADLVGATRETTSSILNRLSRQGIVRLGRRRIVISRPDAVKLASKAVAR